MSQSQKTLDELWEKLALDSLAPDAGAKEDLRATRTRDWEAETLRVTKPEVPAPRPDLPRISITPPVLSETSGDAHEDLSVIGVLGEGGMGRVLLAQQGSLGRDVAVKVTRPEATPGTVQALVHEARTTGRLEHPAVIPVYALASDAQGRPALVMKRVDGVAWSQLLHDDEDPAWAHLAPGDEPHLEAHVSVLVQVCNAVAYAHRRGVLHRDIKPSNVLIGELGEVYVADWGVATKKLLPGAEPRKPSLVGTPVYLAPEMVTGDDAQMDERSDVFLLGATLFEVLSGRPPWGGADLRAVLTAAWECNVPSLPASAPDELAGICRKAMAVRPDERFQSALELRDALVAWQRHRGSVQLARAAQERLDALLSLLRSGAKDRAAIYPLLSECRFGFTQALRDWPENELASLGLRDCIEAGARFELSEGNLDAANALIRELGEVPRELAAAVRRLEAAKAERSQREARLQHLSKELDPRVSQRERLWLFVALTLAVMVIVTSHNVSPTVRGALQQLGPYYLTALMGAVLVVYVLFLFIGRRSLLATRLNRRIAALIGLGIAGPLLNRVLAAQLAAERQQVMVSDLALTAAVMACAGFMLNKSFFLAALFFAAGAVASVVLPQHLSLVYGLTAVLSLVSIATSWRQWRSELWVGDDHTG